MSFGPIPARAAHGRENPVCAPLNRRPSNNRARSVGGYGGREDGLRKNPPVPRAPRAPPRHHGRNQVTEPPVEGGAGELIFGAPQQRLAQAWPPRDCGGEVQFRRVSCLDREFKEKGGSLVVSAHGAAVAAAKSSAEERPDSSAGEHGRVNALSRETEAYGRRLPISNDLRPMVGDPEYEPEAHRRKNTLARELVNEQEKENKPITTDHSRRSALAREIKSNEAPWGPHVNLGLDHRRRNTRKDWYD